MIKSTLLLLTFVGPFNNAQWFSIFCGGKIIAFLVCDDPLLQKLKGFYLLFLPTFCFPVETLVL